MGLYLCGDVLLAPIALDNRTGPKTRPVIVISSSENGTIHICPVSSKPPIDAPSRPLTIDDFASGGLDLFGESYIMTSRVMTLRSGDVIGKKGRLKQDSLEEIVNLMPATVMPGPSPKKRQSGHPRR